MFTIRYFLSYICMEIAQYINYLCTVEIVLKRARLSDHFSFTANLNIRHKFVIGSKSADWLGYAILCQFCCMFQTVILEPSEHSFLFGAAFSQYRPILTIS